MRSTFTAATLFAGLSAVLAQTTTLFANTPSSLITCQPASLSYGGGVAPYFLSVIPGGQAGAAALESFPSASTTAAGAYVWTVNIAAGTSVTIAIRDSQGNLNYSDKVTVLAGPDTSCVGTTASTTSGAAVVTTSAAAGAVTTTSTTKAAGVTTTSAAGASSSAPAAAATTSKAGSASTIGANVLAIMGAVTLAFVL